MQSPQSGARGRDSASHGQNQRHKRLTNPSEDTLSDSWLPARSGSRASVSATNRQDQLRPCHDAAVFQDISECYSPSTSERVDGESRSIGRFENTTCQSLVS